jgi:tetratricopeptide (TPR) repeat protein
VEKAIAINPGDPQFHAHRCEILSKTNRDKEALGFAEDALKRWPESRELLKAKASSLVKLGREDESVEVYDDLERVSGSPALTALQKAVALHDAGRTDEALEVFETLISKYPDDPDSYINKALFHIIRNIEDGIAETYERGLVRLPDSYDLIQSQAFALKDLGRLDESEKVFRHLLTMELDIGGIHEMSYAGLGDALVGLGRYDEAVEAFEKVTPESLIVIDEMDDNLGLAMALHHRNEPGDREKAAAIFGSVSSGPDETAYTSIAHAYLGNKEDACRII